MEFKVEAEGFNISYTSCGEVIIPVKEWIKPLKPLMLKKTPVSDKLKIFSQLYPGIASKDLRALHKLSGDPGLTKLVDAVALEIVTQKLRESRLYSFSTDYKEQYACYRSPRREFDIANLTHKFVLSKYGSFSICVYRRDDKVIVADTTAITPVICCVDAIKAMHKKDFEPETLTKIARLQAKNESSEACN